MNILKLLGLTSYEAKCYHALLSSFGMTAREITDITEIPRVKVYEALDSLVNTNWIEKGHQTPAVFRALPPEDSIYPQSNSLIEMIQTNVKSLQKIWESKTLPLDRPLEHFQSAKQLQSITIDLITNATKSIKLFLRFVLEDELQRIVDELSKKAVQGLEIKIIVHPDILSSENFQKIKFELKKIADVRSAPIPTRLLLVDSSVTLLSTPPDHDDDPQLSTFHTMFVKIPSFVSMIEQSLNASMSQIADII